jgi:hypothetical protein
MNEEQRKKNAERAKRWREKNPGYMTEYMKKYRVENEEKFKASQREYHAKNREARNAARREWSLKNPEKQREATQRWWRENPDRIKDTILRSKYGISLERYNQILQEQGGGCGICGGPPQGGRGGYHVDHNHETGVVRGILCGHCNLLLGHAKESLDVLTKAQAYLIKYEIREKINHPLAATGGV